VIGSRATNSRPWTVFSVCSNAGGKLDLQAKGSLSHESCVPWFDFSVYGSKSQFVSGCELHTKRGLFRICGICRNVNAWDHAAGRLAATLPEGLVLNHDFCLTGSLSRLQEPHHGQTL
jgi:hypothetical protein